MGLISASVEAPHAKNIYLYQLSGRIPSFLFRQLDFVQLRPVLTCDVYLPILRIEGDAVKHIGCDSTQLLREKIPAVDDSFHLSILRIDDQDFIVGIYIGPYLSVNIFKLIEIAYRLAVQGDDLPAFQSEILIHEEQGS